MKSLQKWGGLAALIDAATFIIALGLFFTILAPLNAGTLEPAQTVAFLLENRSFVDAQVLTSYVVFGIFLVVLTLALHDRLKGTSPAFGLIWAGLVIASGMVATIGLRTVAILHTADPSQAVTVWYAVDAVHRGIGGELEIVGALWVLLVSVSALQGRTLPRALNFFGLLIGMAGILTIIPALELIGAVFGLGLIFWFAWIGIVLLQTRTAAASTASHPVRSFPPSHRPSKFPS